LIIFCDGTLSQYSTFTLYGISNVYDTATPTAPAIGAVTDQAGFVSVAFTPTSNDRADLYAVTSSPSGSTTYGATTPIVTPATVGTSYTYQVASVNSLGSSASSASSAVTTANAYSSIFSVTLGSGFGTYIIGNIPQNYTHLQLRVMSRNAGSSVANSYLNFNYDGGNNYSFHWLAGNGSTPSSNNVVGGTGMWTYDAPGTSTTTNCWNVGITDILDYTNTSKFKTIRTLSGYDASGSGIVDVYSGVWNSFAPVSSISFITAGNFLTGTTIGIYGIA
jgi:hypothetical protein